MSDFGELLKKARKSKGIRQRDLAAAVGVAQTTIANYENNVRFPNEHTLIKLSETLDVSLDYLLRDKQEERESREYAFLERSTFKEIQDRYLLLLFEGDQEGAVKLILQVLGQGTSIEDIYTEILEPALRHIGTLWDQGRIHVGQEHFVSESTQMIMAQLQPYMRTNIKKDRRVIILCTGGEQHSIGAKMLTDFFSKDGWNAYYLGTNMPTDGLIKSIEDLSPDLLALSITLPLHVNTAADLIFALRANPSCSNLKIMVGGSAFNRSPELWRTIGADAYAKTAEEAVSVANQLISK